MNGIAWLGLELANFEIAVPTFAITPRGLFLIGIDNNDDVSFK